MIMCTSFNPHVSSVKSSFSNDVDISGMIPLDPAFEPGDNDVICARGKEVYNHEGNARFRALVKSYLPTYSSCVTKMQKTRLVSTIIDTVRTASVYGGFVKNVNGKWYEVGDRRAKEKTGQTMRDLLHTRYSSSTKAKARARRQLREEYNNQSSFQDTVHPVRDMKSLEQPLPPFARSLESPFPPVPRLQAIIPHTNQSIADRHTLSVNNRTAAEIDQYVGSVRGGFEFPLADQIFGFEDNQIKESLDLDPLPLDESIVDVDLDDMSLLSAEDLSDDSFKAAIDSLFSSLQD